MSENIIKTSELTEKTTLTDNDLFDIVDSVGSINKKVKASTVKSYVNPKRFVAQISTDTGNISEWSILENTITEDPQAIDCAYRSEGVFTISAPANTFNLVSVIIGLGTTPQTDLNANVRYCIQSGNAIDIMTELGGRMSDIVLLKATIIIEKF